MAHELCIEKIPPTKNISGHRIVDLNYVLEWSLKLQVDHAKCCTTGTMQLIREDRTGLGLVSRLIFKCNMCEYETSHFTEDPKYQEKSRINYGAVWGTLATGSTYTHLKEQLSALDIPTMSYRLFQTIERQLGNHWKSNLWTSMEQAGQEEYKLALEKNQVNADNTVWTKVYLDGGWSHRSYGHSYNSSSGTAVIIGELTGKVLFLGVRNKYCSICARAANILKPPNPHICFKNWEGSSGAMEADIIVEGFKQSQTMHNLKYLKFVADGDSSVYAKIRQLVPYGDEVIKIECKNHAMKNYGGALYKVKADTKINVKGRKLLTVQAIKNLENIAMKQLSINANGNVEKLKTDWANGPNHVFGNHSKCSSDYCETVGLVHHDKIQELESTGIQYHINGVLDRLISKAHKLISNETNNKAELFMSFLAKFNAAKRLNLTQRGSFEERSSIAGLKYNKGIAWQASPWKRLMEESPGQNFKKYQQQIMNDHKVRVKRRLDFNEGGSRRLKNRSTSRCKQLTGYGPKALQADFTDDELLSEKNRILEKMKVAKDQIIEIERKTVGQWGNVLYEQLRQYRLTASNFGAVIKRRTTTPPDNLIKHILGKSYANSDAIDYGKSKELVARKKFAESRPTTTVEECGIFICEKYPYLAATPDGLVGRNAIMEIKCLHKVHKSEKSLEDAIKIDKTLCVEISEGRIKLKKNHNYYYQVQGQLNISKKDMCFFIIYINDLQPLHVEVILRDSNLWEEKMLPKLTEFYEKHVLIAIANRHLTNIQR